MKEIVIAGTGIGNLASVMAGLRRAGAKGRVSTDPEELADAPLVLLPGVGAFGAAMRVLSENRAVDAVRSRIAEGKPTLGICLGMQMAFESSEEAPGVRGVGAIEGEITRFAGDLPVPQIGWNMVKADPECRILASGWACYANSFRALSAPGGWFGAESDYGGTFVAGLERGNVVFCQFHPELSGSFGLGIIERWIRRSAEGGV